MNLQKHSESYIFPSRSKFQLEKFVIGQHDTPQMKWKQLVLEGQQLAYNVKSAEISIEKNKIEMERLLKSKDELDALDAEQKRLDIIFTERTLAGAKIELKWLEEIAETVGSFSFEEIEQDQETYWKLRLQRQAEIDVFSRGQGISASNISSMINIGEIQFDSKETNEIHNLEA